MRTPSCISWVCSFNIASLLCRFIPSRSCALAARVEDLASEVHERCMLNGRISGSRANRMHACTLTHLILQHMHSSRAGTPCFGAKIDNAPRISVKADTFRRSWLGAAYCSRTTELLRDQHCKQTLNLSFNTSEIIFMKATQYLIVMYFTYISRCWGYAGIFCSKHTNDSYYIKRNNCESYFLGSIS
jgi:hypothetical protein